MLGSVRVKVCGLTDSKGVASAVDAGVSYIGLVHFPKSPRHVGIEVARELALQIPVGVAKVALMVNATDEVLDAFVGAVPLDILQLHGAETPERVREIRNRYGLPVMKAIGVATARDLAAIDEYAGVCDQLLVDAKPPKGADRPGGNAIAFDWQLIAGRRWPLPWMLAGGLTPENVGDAIKRTGARQLDVSSGVESAPGVKDEAKIRAFMDAVREA